MTARLFTDGGARGNPGPAAYAYVLAYGSGLRWAVAPLLVLAGWTAVKGLYALSASPAATRF